MEYLKHLPTNLISSWWMDEFYHFSEKKFSFTSEYQKMSEKLSHPNPQLPGKPYPYNHLLNPISSPIHL